MTERQPATGLRTVSLRRRVTLGVIGALTLVLILLGLVVDAVFAAQSERNLEALLTGRVQLARQLARSGVPPQRLVNRVGANGVLVSLRLRGGTQLGSTPAPGDRIRTVEATLHGPGRVNGARLTLSVDTSLAADARRDLRRTLLISSAVAVLLSALLVVLLVRLALAPLTAMAGLAQTITRGRRGSRLTPTRTDTELGRTAAAFDDMLDELEGAEARAQAAEQRTRSFLADAAHELRTPIAGVQAAAETLLQQEDRIDPRQRERLEVLLIQEAQRAGKLVADLLAAARLDAGIELTRAPVALDELAEAEVERARLLHPEASITLAGHAPPIVGDAEKLGAVLRNLLDNALRAAGPSGRVAVTLAEGAGNVVLEVTDSGPGVPPADRERIFDRLVRLDTGRTADAGGSGLGLAIARGYARAHGGELTCADPGPSGGARFRLVLPAG